MTTKSRPNFGVEFIIYTLLSLFVAAVATIIALPLYLVRGFVFMKLWNWFVFGQMTSYHMSWIIGSGITMIVGFLVAQYTTNKDERTNKEKYIALGGALLSPFVVLFFGWILTLFL